MKFKKRVLPLLSLCLLGFSPSAFSDGPQNTQKKSPAAPAKTDGDTDGFSLVADSTIVTVNLTALDAKGNPVSDLKGKDVQVFEDGKQQPISDFQASKLPYNYALLLDCSNSMQKTVGVDNVINSTQAFVDQDRNLKDKFAVFCFEGPKEFHQLTELTSDRAALHTAISKYYSRGSTDEEGSITQTAQYLAKAAPEDLNSIVLVTDGGQSYQRGDMDRIQRVIHKSNVSVHVIDMAGDKVDESRHKYLQQLSAQSGGVWIRADDSSQLKQSYADLRAKTSDRYKISYTPANTAKDGSYRHIDVKISNRPDITDLSFRTGYFAASDDDDKDNGAVAAVVGHAAVGPLHQAEIISADKVQRLTHVKAMRLAPGVSFQSKQDIQIPAGSKFLIQNGKKTNDLQSVNPFCALVNTGDKDLAIKANETLSLESTPTPMIANEQRPSHTIEIQSLFFNFKTSSGQKLQAQCVFPHVKSSADISATDIEEPLHEFIDYSQVSRVIAAPSIENNPAKYSGSVFDAKSVQPSSLPSSGSEKSVNSTTSGQAL
jgi:VWFA-related protein